MSDRQAEKIPPAILVLKEVIRDYRAVNDPAGLGALLFSLEQCLSGEKYTPPKTGGELNTFNRLLAAAKRGIESYEKMSERGRKGAAATNALKQTQTAQAANPSPSGGTCPADRNATGRTRSGEIATGGEPVPVRRQTARTCPADGNATGAHVRRRTARRREVYRRMF